MAASTVALRLLIARDSRVFARPAFPPPVTRIEQEHLGALLGWRRLCRSVGAIRLVGYEENGTGLLPKAERDARSLKEVSSIGP